MRRTNLNLIIDMAAFALFLGMIASGLIVRYFLPPGSGGYRHPANRTVWGISRHDWGEVHFYLAAGFLALVAVHVALHWTWICETLRRRLAGARLEAGAAPRRGWWAVFFSIAVLCGMAVFLLLAAAGVGE